MVEKREGFKCALMGSNGHRKAGGRLTGNGLLRDWLEVHSCLFLIGPYLEAGTKIREVVSY